MYDLTIQGVKIHYIPIKSKPIDSPEDRLEVSKLDTEDTKYVVRFKQHCYEEKGFFKKRWLYEGTSYLYVTQGTHNTFDWTREFKNARIFKTKKEVDKMFRNIKKDKKYPLILNDVEEVVGLM